MKFKSLKFRINLITLIYSVIIILISSMTMFLIVSKLISNRIEEENVYFLSQVQNTLENNFTKLNSICLLFTPYGNLGESLVQFNEIENVGEKAIMMSKIKADMGVISFSNPDVTLCTFFFNEDYMDFIGTTASMKNIDFELIPEVFQDNNNTFYGPHQTAKMADESLVISVRSIVDIGSIQNTFVYVEMTFTEIEAMLKRREDNGYSYLLVDENNRIIYSTDKFIESNTDYAIYIDGKQAIVNEVESHQGWRIISVVEPSKIKDLKSSLIYDSVVVYPLILIPGILFSMILMKIIIRPLQRFQQGVEQMEEGDFDTVIPKTDIQEFDILIERIHKAKYMISNLMDEIREKEKRRAFAEISRLRAQINPHFVLNTLNSIHWMALQYKQPQIDQIVMSLTKILSYNLKNKEYTATISDELEATQEYLELQKLKYDLDYRIENKLGDDGLEHIMPRFILQPLVENSILHGKTENISILIAAQYIDEGVMLILRDGGGKINEHSLKYIQEHQTKPEKLGIGLSYVFSALKTYYNRDDLILFLDIETGVEIRILLPMGRGLLDENSNDC